MEEERLPKKAFRWNIPGKKKRDWFKKRWLLWSAGRHEGEKHSREPMGD